MTSFAVPAGRIVVSGFSQGGAMSLVTGLQSDRALAGVLSMSGWIPGSDHFQLSGQWRGSGALSDLLFVRVLAQPAQLGAAVHHPLLHLEEHRRRLPAAHAPPARVAPALTVEPASGRAPSATLDAPGTDPRDVPTAHPVGRAPWAGR